MAVNKVWTFVLFQDRNHQLAVFSRPEDFTIPIYAYTFIRLDEIYRHKDSITMLTLSLHDIAILFSAVAVFREAKKY